MLLTRWTCLVCRFTVKEQSGLTWGYVFLDNFIRAERLLRPHRQGGTSTQSVVPAQGDELLCEMSC